jgi:formylglycine-generating enzyme required for sulfatase activity
MPSPATGETTRMPPLPPTSETARLIEEPPAQQPTPPTLQETAPTAPAQGVVAEPEKSAPLAPAQVHVPSDAVTPAVQTSAAVTQAPVSSAAQAPAAATPKPASGRSLAIAGAVAVLLLLAVGGTFAAGLWSGDQSAMAPTSAPATSAPATSAPAQSGETAAPATEAPEQATEAPPPAELPPPIGDIAFEEDFSAGGQRNGLDDQVPDTEFSRGFHSPGVYHFRAAKPNETRWVVMPRQMYAEFTMQLEAWDFSDEFVGGVAQGVIFRVRDSDHFYAFLLDPRAGRYTVRKHDGPDQWTDIIPWKESPLVKRGVEVNTIRVDGKGGDFTIFLNGQQAETFTDSSFERGMLGMIIANGDANAPHMHFDNMSVWSEDAAPQASSLEPTRETPAGTMVLIPGGEFVLGSNDRSDTPPHIVGLPDFYIDTSEVTNRNYETCVGDGACTPPQSPASQSHPNYATQEEYADYPVMHVSWEQANQFCQWAGKRLPTEAEWEKAAAWSAAANAKTAWPFGNEFDPALLNSAESNTGDTTAAGAYPPEVNGTFDMAGNVAEWTSSLYKPYPYDPSDGREDPEASGERILRGGSWAQTKGKALSALRLPVAPDYFDREIGFRCAITP